MTEEEQKLYRCLLQMKPLTKLLVGMLSMARRELNVAEDFPSVCKARGKVEILTGLLSLKKKLQKKQ